MSKTYQVTPFVRFVNRMMRLMIRFNVAPKGYCLTVLGAQER